MSYLPVPLLAKLSAVEIKQVNYRAVFLLECDLSVSQSECEAWMNTRDQLSLFTGNTGGLDNWLTSDKSEMVLKRIEEIPVDPISKSVLNQLLALSHQPDVSAGFFEYYWCSIPEHPYDLGALPAFDSSYAKLDRIMSIDQLSWGLSRIYLDSLLYFGSLRNGFSVLRELSDEELTIVFQSKMIDTTSLIRRGRALPLHPISQDDRYLIAEQACKSFEPVEGDELSLWNALLGAWVEHKEVSGTARITAKELLNSACIKPEFADKQGQLLFAADEILESPIASEEDLREKYDALLGKFSKAREAALRNTELYLSMANDLDIYVATSMRNRQQFRDMARTCDSIFQNSALSAFNIRYFDPTMSAARGHEDKGLLECLMVKCAKVLIYTAGERDSYGKDAEAAMALSLGKPVVFLCDEESRRRFFKEVHPLSRLIEFSTGVAVGADPSKLAFEA